MHLHTALVGCHYTANGESNILKLVNTIQLFLKSKDANFSGSQITAKISPLGEIYRLANRWQENNYAYFVLEELNGEIKSILHNTPRSIEIKDEYIVLFMMIASLHYGGNWIYWQHKLKNDDIVSKHLLKILEIEYIRPRFRALFALQSCEKSKVETNLSKSILAKDKNLKIILTKYIYTKTFEDYLKKLGKSSNTDYNEKARKVLAEIYKFSANINSKTSTNTLPKIS